MNKFLAFLRKEMLFLTLFVFTVVIVFFQKGLRTEQEVLWLYCSIGVFSLIGVFFSKDKSGVSLNKIFCLFYYFFFSLSPIIQYKNKISFQIGDRILSSSLYLKMGWVLLVILGGYLVLYNFFFVFFEKTKLPFKANKISKLNNLSLLYGLSLLSAIGYIFLIKFNWELLLFRPFVFKLKDHTAFGLIGYALLLVIRYIPYFVLLYYKVSVEKNDKHMIILFVTFLVVLFPTSLSRGVLAVVYIPLLLLFVPFFRKGINFVLLIVLGQLVIFPLWNNFRHLKEGGVAFNYELFDTAHFDAFQNFSLLVDENIVTNGRQLLGSILFFIQESQWENRPNGSGHLLGETVGYPYLNVAMPYFGEGFINFGWLGVLFFLLIIVGLNSYLDSRLKIKNYSFWLKTNIFILMSWEFYLLRGDMLSSIKMISSLLLGFVFFYVAIRIYNKTI